MSGHSHAANIAAKKAKTDAAKGKIFTKVGREIAVAAKNNPDPDTNSKLADAIAKAKAVNMPNENIKRCIAKAAGELASDNFEELTYEGYGPAGSAVIIKALTDNKNRTVDWVRTAMRKHGGSLGNSGCVSFTFTTMGIIVIERTPDLDEDTVMEYALDAGADDIITEDDAFEVHTSVANFSQVRKYLEEKGLNFFEAQIEMVPQNVITLEGEELAKFKRLIDALEDLDDVQNVYHNVDMPEDEEE
ncbi:MAG: YebC/PmpR family DNA-binding transcriptional regulator [Clostridia bacterium]|nr:YebC/PmpR family DNA-binding transcriptional regulator [Clostridia bacterium]MBQ8197769.1 YebC/PmpR family DNA-binding transcriptional regulator [Clostridia bacterium]